MEKTEIGQVQSTKEDAIEKIIFVAIYLIKIMFAFN